MGTYEYISENEAAAIAGISVKTLKQFIEAGYLKPEADGDGLQLILRDEVHSLFGVTSDSSATSAADDSSATSTTSSSETSSQSIATPPASMPTGDSNRSAADAATNPHEQKVAAVTATTVSIPTPGPQLREQFRSLTRPNTEGVGLSSNAGNSVFERELDKYRSLHDMQQKLLDLRETEIERLQSERDWLRRRIERLEEQNQRNQVILLTETQMIGQIMASRQDRRGPVKTLLGWIGLSSNQPANVPPGAFTTPSETARNHASDNVVEMARSSPSKNEESLAADFKKAV